MPHAGGPGERIIDRVDSLTGWSPDGRHMAFVHGADRPAAGAVPMLADRGGRRERPLASVREAATLAAVGSDPRSSGRLWLAHEPGGQLTRLLSDEYDYAGVSATVDGAALVTARSTRRGPAAPSDIVLIKGIRP